MAPVIQTHGLTKMYGSQRGIEDLNLSVERGEVFGYLGPNGAGKTTTIRLFLNFIRPSRGSLLILGKSPGFGGRTIRSRIGYLPGELGLYDSTTGEGTLDLYRKLSGGKAPLREWLCDALSLSEQDRKRRIKYYSKGMKQKLGIVQAIQHDPDLVILDEPTGGLDPLVQIAFYDVLRELKARGRTVFFSSHVLSEVQRMCDRVAVLRDGKLVLNSTIGEMMAVAERNLWIRLEPSGAGDDVPQIAKATFLRHEGDWLVYRTKASDAPVILDELAILRPADFRFESALEDSFLQLYGVQGP